MSEPLDLAASIRANTAAVQALTAAFLQGLNCGIVPPQAVLVVPKIDVAQARRELQDAAAEDEAFAAIAKAKLEKPSAAATEVTLDDVKKAAVALAKKDREKLAAALAKFNAPKVIDLKPRDYHLFLDAIAA
jgi:hypothetical protein